MIASLDDAWKWYESSRLLAATMGRLGARHWDGLPWDGDLGRDEKLRELDAADIGRRARSVLEELDDFCVLLLFSVFEATVRGQVLREMDFEVPLLRHPTIKSAAMDARDGVEHGSFARVVEPFKARNAELIEEVNQVRRYRNWVAHGRRSVQPEIVTPASAKDRLQRFVDLLTGTAPS